MIFKITKSLATTTCARGKLETSPTSSTSCGKIFEKKKKSKNVFQKFTHESLKNNHFFEKVFKNSGVF